MHTLRNAPWLARLALLWFVLTLGVAVASPMISGDQQVMLCSAGGVVKVVINEDGSTSSAPTALDCPLCAVGGAIVVSTAAPPPARGPPLAPLL
ncbi:MAG: hypothetical protein CVU24_16120 [Betaproteobacteria bacterium HGW-Betaproteobacteria-18]|nr:MAG: hypothetical protein CVU24_16120 [Betaproteobacteria bacterium HGW-Betaproteobacteria-18]